MEDLIKYWVEKVNKEYNKSDMNQYCIDFFTELYKDSNYIFHFFNWGYVVLCLGIDLWGEKFLGVVSYYIDKEERKNPKHFIHIQDLIEKTAKAEQVDYIEQGSHKNNKLNDLLEKKYHYKKSVYRRYING